MPDPVLPTFTFGTDPGPSFADLLRKVAPHQLPGANVQHAITDAVPHGTTVVAIRSATGVVMAGDRRATSGYTIASRRIEKVFPADDFSGVAIAGAAGPAVEMVKLFQVQLEHYEKVQGDVLSLEGKANQLSQLVRSNLPAALQGFVVVPLFAGYDHKREIGRVYSYDVTGGRYEELDFQSNGSGSVHARNWIKAGWREGMSNEEIIDLALTSLFAAADEDVATGGPDLVRRIFPTIAVIDTEGFRAISDDEIARRADALLSALSEEGTKPNEGQAKDTGPVGCTVPRGRSRAGGRSPMSMPFYVSPEQLMKDRADFARKGIARGRSLLALECAPGVVIVADNPSKTLSKISEIYDRIAFAAVGLYSEYQILRIAGVRHADMKGFSYSREDVSAKELANAYSQTLHQIFTHETKPYEVEILVVEVGRADDDHSEMYHVMYDGVVIDEHGFSALGGQADQITEKLKEGFDDHMSLADAVKLGAQLLGPDTESLGTDELEVALLDRSRPRRAFRRIKNAELEGLLG